MLSKDHAICQPIVIGLSFTKIIKKLEKPTQMDIFSSIGVQKNKCDTSGLTTPMRHIPLFANYSACLALFPNTGPNLIWRCTSHHPGYRVLARASRATGGPGRHRCDGAPWTTTQQGGRLWSKCHCPHGACTCRSWVKELQRTVMNRFSATKDNPSRDPFPRSHHYKYYHHSEKNRYRNDGHR